MIAAWIGFRLHVLRRLHNELHELQVKHHREHMGAIGRLTGTNIPDSVELNIEPEDPMAAITPATDAPGFNFSVLKKGTQVAGYTTGSGGVQWTAPMWAEFPGAVRICQDPRASDTTADILDVEQGAASIAECAAWKKAAQKSFENGTRPGQREPAVYCSASNVTAVANAMVAAGITRCPVWVAHFGIGVSAAQAMLNESSGPYPVIGVQFANGPTFDSDLFLTSWLGNISGKAVPVTMNAPPGQWNAGSGWDWADCTIVGVGLDGKLHTFTFNPVSGIWAKVE